MLGEKGRRIRELTAVVQKRFGFPEGSVEVHYISDHINVRRGDCRIIYSDACAILFFPPAYSNLFAVGG